MFQVYTKTKNLSLRVECPEDAVVLYTDKQKIVQILINYLSNAAKYSNEGGAVLSIAELPDDRVRFSVSDSGQGIPESQRIYLFERFTRLNQEVNANIQGTGLGLALVAEYADLLQGTAEYEKSEMGGSVFSITIPRRLGTGGERT